MVKSYLQFEHSKTFGQVCSSGSNAVWIETSTSGTKTSSAGLAVVGANEEVLVWDIKKSELRGRWSVDRSRSPVTCIARSHVDPDIFAVGYADGKIRIWDLRTATVIIEFNGHKSAITQLRFDTTGARLVSGAKDTDIIFWDLVAEVGLFKLRGHKDQITSLNLLSAPVVADNSDANATGPLVQQYDAPSVDTSDAYLLSTSKDALIKVWDLSTQHCVETQVAQSNGECWALGLSPDQSGCITAGNDGELRAWSINLSATSDSSRTPPGKASKILQDRGSIYRQGKDRTICVKFHPNRDLLAIHGSEKAVELWRMRSEKEIQKSLARKRRRKREKAVEDGVEDPPGDPDDKLDVSSADVSDVFVPYVIVRTGGKIRSMDWASGKSTKSVSIITATTNNQIEMFNVETQEKKRSKIEQPPDYSRDFSVDMPGHRSDIRCIALSSDDRMLATASHGSLKVWNIKTESCIRTLDCGYALCTTFLPGDKIVVVGTRDGTLEIFDIASSTLLETIEAHERDIWSLQVSPDGKSLVTGSADKSAKFWEFRVVQEEILGTNRRAPKLTLVHTRTLKVADDILSLRFSPDARLLAISTLDNTVKVFFVDSLKLFLTLYGHKLPVLSIDISYDSKLIVTSSADKNVRIWGLDFGDCHKAFFAHQDSILSVAFMPNNNNGNGHHFFSASKDRTVKYYDGDKFELIQKLDGHHGEIWALSVSHSGDFLVSASHDKSIRVWKQTDEQLFLEEEREKELEELYENTLLTTLEKDDQETNGEAGVDGVAAAGRQTVQTLMAGEKIAEALQLGMEDLTVMNDHKRALLVNHSAGPPQRNPVFLANKNMTASAYVLQTFQRIPSASLQDGLLVISFSQLPLLFAFLAIWAAESRNIPLTCRVLLFMVKTHQKQIVSSRLMRSMLEEVRDNLQQTLQRQKGELGYNLAGLRIIGRKLNDVSESDYLASDGAKPTDEDEKGKKRAFVSVA